MNFKHMDFQKKTMLTLVVLLIVILVYAVAFAAPVRRKSEECQEELVRTERQIREQKDLSENKRWIEQEMDGLPFRMEELPEYNNQKHEMKELKEIFDGIPGYGLEFQTEKINEMLMTRDVTVTCEISGIEELEEITGRTYSRIHVVGGGSNAGYLNELTAKATGKEVHAGPGEATAIGNITAQMLKAGDFKSVEEARTTIHESFGIKIYK